MNIKPIIDIHSHIYPKKIAQIASNNIGEFYDIKMNAKGSSNKLLKLSKDTPITHHVVHSVAVKPENVKTINDFIAIECKQHKEFIGFMTMHQDFDNMEDEIDRALGLGLCGIKIHPDFQKVNLDDERFMQMYEIAERKHIPVMIHTGDYRYDYTHPRRTKRVLHEFPNLIMDAAHFGGWSIFDLAVEYLENENCYVDCSSSFAFLGRRRTKELIEIYGTDRVLFGVDFPMWTPQKEYEFFTTLDLTDAQFEEILTENPQKYLGRKVK